MPLLQCKSDNVIFSSMVWNGQIKNKNSRLIERLSENVSWYPSKNIYRTVAYNASSLLSPAIVNA